jgi:hypothetical protein
MSPFGLFSRRGKKVVFLHCALQTLCLSLSLSLSLCLSDSLSSQGSQQKKERKQTNPIAPAGDLDSSPCSGLPLDQPGLGPFSQPPLHFMPSLSLPGAHSL